MATGDYIWLVMLQLHTCGYWQLLAAIGGYWHPTWMGRV